MSVLQSATPVLLRTAKCYSTTTPVRLCTTKYYSCYALQTKTINQPASQIGRPAGEHGAGRPAGPHGSGRPAGWQGAGRPAGDEIANKSTALSNFCTSQLQKVLLTPQFFRILTSKCASRHSGVQFLNISTSKSAPNLQFFSFHFNMCFSPQRRAILEHLNFKKWSENVSF